MPGGLWPKIGSDAHVATAIRGAAIVLGAYFIGFLVFAILTQRGLVGDGAGYFLRLLIRRTVVSPEISRWAANLLTEWPVLLALSAGITDTTTWSVLYSVGLFCPSVATLALNWLLLAPGRKGLFALPLLSLAFGWMGSSYGIISQGQLAALWFWPTAFALAFARLDTVRGAALVLLLALPTILMHEAQCLYGPILAALAWWRARGEPRPGIRWLWVLVGLWLFAGAVLALYFTLVPLNPGDRAGFIAGLTRLYFVYQPPWSWNPPVVVALVSGALMAWCCWAEGWARRFRLVWLPAYGAFLLAAALAPLVFPDRFAPQLQLDARSWAVAVPLLLLAALVAWWAGLLPIRPTIRPLLALVVALATTAQITWQVAATLRWDAFIAGVRHELATHRGYLAYEAAFAPGTPVGPAAGALLATGWTFPQLSIALAPGGRVATIIGNPTPIGWQSFDPTRPAALPPATGIDYSEYVRALETQ